MAVSDQSSVRNRHRSALWFPALLVGLALLDLRTDLLLLVDHFTVTSLLFTVRYHLLAVVVLLASASLWRRYQ